MDGCYRQLDIINARMNATRDRILELREEVMDITAREQELTMGLQDVLTELKTPPGSDSEDDEPVCGQNATDKARMAAMSEADHRRARKIMKQMRSAKAEPASTASFAYLYTLPRNRVAAERKMKKLKRFLKRADFDDAFSDPLYWKELSELKATYSERDGRPGLHKLVAFFLFQRKKFEFFFGSTSDEEDQDETIETDASGSEGNAPENQD